MGYLSKLQSQNKRLNTPINNASLPSADVFHTAPPEQAHPNLRVNSHFFLPLPFPFFASGFAKTPTPPSTTSSPCSCNSLTFS